MSEKLETKKESFAFELVEKDEHCTMNDSYSKHHDISMEVKVEYLPESNDKIKKRKNGAVDIENSKEMET